MHPDVAAWWRKYQMDRKELPEAAPLTLEEAKLINRNMRSILQWANPGTPTAEEA